jgi:hypothetical protein
MIMSTSVVLRVFEMIELLQHKAMLSCMIVEYHIPYFKIRQLSPKDCYRLNENITMLGEFVNFVNIAVNANRLSIRTNE